MTFLLDYGTWMHIRKPWKILESKLTEERQVNKQTRCQGQLLQAFYTRHLCLGWQNIMVNQPLQVSENHFKKNNTLGLQENAHNPYSNLYFSIKHEFIWQ
jgi:hypothetical protein